jgi:hypothetical protein
MAFSNANVHDSFVRDHVYVSHILTVGTQLGFFKSYEFSRSLVATFAWDMMRNNIGLDFSIGF